jgi:hypothetical protein
MVFFEAFDIDEFNRIKERRLEKEDMGVGGGCIAQIVLEMTKRWKESR